MTATAQSFDGSAIGSAITALDALNISSATSQVVVWMTGTQVTVANIVGD